ncbi:MAG: hypothetical protein GX154_11915, partial [Clostridiales bacterium]|nr:hypothetical protein [Clostridiales bacterium]
MKEFKPFKININGESSGNATILDPQRILFLEWLSNQNSVKYDIALLVKSFDSISEYAIRKGICKVCFWHIIEPLEFQKVYDKILGDKLFKVIYKKAYKNFLKVGKLYTEFLQKNSLKMRRLKAPELMVPIVYHRSFAYGLSITSDAKKEETPSLKVEFCETIQEIHKQKIGPNMESKLNNKDCLSKDSEQLKADKLDKPTLKKINEISYSEKSIRLLELH